MGTDIFICGSCQQVFHNVDEFIQHKTECKVVAPEGSTQRSVVLLQPADGADTGNQQFDGAEQLPPSGGEQVYQISSAICAQEPSEVSAPLQIVQQVVGEAENTEPSAGLQHHVVHLQNHDGLYQLHIDTAPGHNVQIQDIVHAMEQGQAIKIQDNGMPVETTEDKPMEIHLVRAADCTDTGGTEPIISALPNVKHPETTPKPARRRGRPRKGEEKTKPVTAPPQPVEDTRPKEPEKDPDGKLVCARCKKKFSKERHFNTHKCLALTDYVDVLEKEINSDEDSDGHRADRSDTDFRAPPSAKKRKIHVEENIRAPVIDEPAILSIPETTVLPVDKQTDSTTKLKVEEVPEDPDQKSANQSEATVIEGSGNNMEEIPDLAKEGLADFPGAGDIKLSQVRVDDGTDDPKLQDPLTAALQANSGNKENPKSRRGRKPRGTFGNLDPNRKSIKNLPIFKTEEDRLEFEKCTNVELYVDNLFRQHIIDQDVNEYGPPLKHRVSNKLSVFSCNLCEKIIMSKSHARLHCITHTDLKPFKCFKCDFATNTKGNLYSHMRKHTGQMYRCSGCPFATVNKAHLLEHEAVHLDQRHKCQICDKDYSTEKSLCVHVRRQHSKTKKGMEYMLTLCRGKARNQAILHQCQICNRKFKKKIDKDRHMYIHDIKDNPNVHLCELCKCTCSRRQYLERHLTRHRIIYFCCDCDEKFPSTVHLTQHLKVAHLSTEGATDDLMKQHFEKCIENSIYLPEPDGSISFEDEVEEGDSVLSTMKNHEVQLQTTHDASSENNSNINLDNQTQLRAGTDDPSQSVTMEDVNKLSEISNDMPKDAQVTMENEVTEHSKDPVKVVVEPAEASNEDIVQSAQEPIPDTTNDEQTNEISSDAPTTQTDATSPDQAENKESDADTQVKPVYDKDFFNKAGFKPLSMETYNRIRQIFGREECEYCGRLYFSTHDFEQHLRTHTGERPFGCNQCKYRAISKENLKRHIEKEHDKVKFACNDCDFLASSRSQLWTHVQTHKHPDAYSCPVCDKSYPLAKLLKIHIGLTHPDMTDSEIKLVTMVQHRARARIGRKCYKCPHCDRGIFKNPADLQKHIWIHEGIKPFKCPLCPHACRSRNNLASHMIRHSLDKPFLCTECGRAYKSKTALRWHVRSHKDGKFKCPKCPYEATQMSHIKRHLETHDIIKRYVCRHCSYSANTIGYLKIHYTRHHKGQMFSHSTSVTNELPMVRTSPNADTKIYRCLSCDYLFGNLSDMKRHLKLRHHIQMENMEMLDEISATSTPHMLSVSMEDTPQQGQMVEQSIIHPDPQDPDVQIVQLTNGLDLSEEATTSQTGTVQQLQYSGVTDDTDEKMQSAVSILQQIIDMSQQGTLGEQEITVKSEDGQSFIVQHEGEVVVASDPSEIQTDNQYVIRYVTPDGQEITIGEHNSQQVHNEVIADSKERSESEIHENLLAVELQQQGISEVVMNQTDHVLVDTHQDVTQTLALDTQNVTQTLALDTQNVTQTLALDTQNVTQNLTLETQNLTQNLALERQNLALDTQNVTQNLALDTQNVTQNLALDTQNVTQTLVLDAQPGIEDQVLLSDEGAISPSRVSDALENCGTQPLVLNFETSALGGSQIQAHIVTMEQGIEDAVENVLYMENTQTEVINSEANPLNGTESNLESSEMTLITSDSSFVDGDENLNQSVTTLSRTTSAMNIE